ncbi:Ethanolamine kinase 2 [Sphaceloma murrayae]|uniref:Ethanolamine kinase 2 n=1 Tax=Sphaceloma murrayae TaxID=2082308 RepID=A0A2K1QYB9_9PEZI|nr:Ethanolamine kinase 2 [Sphaceloma murrayae]
MGEAKPGKKSLKDRLGLSSKHSAPRQRLVKKSLTGQRIPSEDSQDYVVGHQNNNNHERPLQYRPQSRNVANEPRVEEDYLYRPTDVDYTVAPEQRYARKASIPPATVGAGSQRNGDDPFGDQHKIESPQLSNQPNFNTAHDFHKHAIDKNTGERKDLTEMMHAFHFDESMDEITEELPEEHPEIDPTRPRGEEILTKPSAEIWDRITDFLEPREAANLALTCKTVWYLLGSKPFDALRQPSNKQQREAFLLPMDVKFPNQLFCFPCASFHARTHPGRESLQPTNVLNPLFDCPNKTNNMIPPPRHRISGGRTLPFTFVQLVTRAHRFGPDYGLSEDSLDRRWRDHWSEWSHHTKYHVHKNGHLLMRVVSQVFATGGLTLAAKRMLLYSRDDYQPYFSVCAHWRDGLLMDNCKCALNHFPKGKNRAALLGGHQAARPGVVSLCGDCQPMRRCPRCPTEYLIEVKLVEDKSVAINDTGRFKNALIVTRWSDLGDGISPQSREWAAVQGENEEEYDSIKEVGNRSISAIFESAFGEQYPAQRLLNLNPRDIREGEEGNKWY